MINEFDNFDLMPTMALLGTGLLGEAIGRRLLEQVVTLKIWNGTTKKCEPLLKQGAALIENLDEAAKGCQSVIMVLRDGPESADVIAELGDLHTDCCLLLRSGWGQPAVQLPASWLSTSSLPASPTAIPWHCDWFKPQA